jgi:hypothetical protein
MGPVIKTDFTKRSAAIWHRNGPWEWIAQKYRWYSVPNSMRWFVPVFLYVAPVLTFRHSNERRCTVIAAVSLGMGIGESIGSHKRLGIMTFGWQMKQPVRAANPNVFTAYYLPRYVSRSSQTEARA